MLLNAYNCYRLGVFRFILLFLYKKNDVTCVYFFYEYVLVLRTYFLGKFCTVICVWARK